MVLSQNKSGNARAESKNSGITDRGAGGITSSDKLMPVIGLLHRTAPQLRKEHHDDSGYQRKQNQYLNIVYPYCI